MDYIAFHKYGYSAGKPELPTINDDNYKNRYVDLTKLSKISEERVW